MRVRFANGYGASIIDDGYGSAQGLAEVAVIHYGPEGSSTLCYATPVTGDVLGYMTGEDVAEALAAIAALPAKDHCNHDMR